MNFNLSDRTQLQKAKERLELLAVEGLTIEIKTPSKTRTSKQNAALHVYFELLAIELNDAGLSMMKVLKPSAEIAWSANSIKQFLWGPIMKALLDKQSTTQLNTGEVSQVYDTLNRHLGEKFGISVTFPQSIDLIE